MEHAESQTSVDGVVAAGDPDVTMEVLRSHVPLTLLMDISSAEGPDSVRISAIEGGDAGWLTDTAAQRTGQPIVAAE